MLQTLNSHYGSEYTHFLSIYYTITNVGSLKTKLLWLYGIIVIIWYLDGELLCLSDWNFK